MSGVKVTITWGHLNPERETIWTALARELGREPTHAEARERVRAILRRQA